MTQCVIHNSMSHQDAFSGAGLKGAENERRRRREKEDNERAKFMTRQKLLLRSFLPSKFKWKMRQILWKARQMPRACQPVACWILSCISMRLANFQFSGYKQDSFPQQFFFLLTRFIVKWKEDSMRLVMDLGEEDEGHFIRSGEAKYEKMKAVERGLCNWLWE